MTTFFFIKDPKFTSMMGRCFVHICVGCAPALHYTKNQTDPMMTLPECTL